MGGGSGVDIIENKWKSYYICAIGLTSNWAFGVSIWTQIGKGSAIGTNSTVNIIQQLAIVPDEPGEATACAVDIICYKSDEQIERIKLLS